mmetsp:Transcript_123404/g.293243  ORF Transcript_123404/g.293243 Transcript_123404/m.293243 type:complete len:240 (-) Transcript_123404:302-1021(-)
MHCVATTALSPKAGEKGSESEFRAITYSSLPSVWFAACHSQSSRGERRKPRRLGVENSSCTPRAPRVKPVMFTFFRFGFQPASCCLAAMALKTSCGAAPATTNSAVNRGTSRPLHMELFCQIFISCPSASFLTSFGADCHEPFRLPAALAKTCSRRLSSGFSISQPPLSFNIQSGAFVSLDAQPSFACCSLLARRCSPKATEVCQPAFATNRALRGQGCSLTCWEFRTRAPPPAFGVIL